MTEEEAKQKKCPTQPGMCIGSACMAWRWDHSVYTGVAKRTAEEKAAEGWKIFRWRVGQTGTTYDIMRPSEDGFCGLAGQTKP